MFVRLKGQEFGKGAAGKWTDYVALLVMLRRLRLCAFPQAAARLASNIIFFAVRCERGCASINAEARLCLKNSSFPEPLGDIEQRHLSSSASDISFISGEPAPNAKPCEHTPTNS